MTGADPDRLQRLLPVVYRLRDAAVGGPLRALLRVIGEQVDLVDADVARLYANWFIETCDDWVVPYLGDLIGYTPVSRTGRFPARREVANTIASRRRKGTLAVLEQLAGDVAGWPARAVEFYALLHHTQSTQHVRLDRGRTLDLRDDGALDRLGGPFEEAVHLVDVRRIDAPRDPGRFNIPSVGLFVWRLRPYSITKAPAYAMDEAPNQFTFSILGNDTQLVTLPVSEPTPTHIADEANVPADIRRHAFEERTADYYGPGKSLLIWRDAPDSRVPLAQVVPADLSGWSYRPSGDQVAVDPVLGRIAFHPDSAPETGVWVSYHYGFSDDLGGGEYWRRLSPTAGRALYRVGEGQPDPTVMDAVRRWQADKAAGRAGPDAVIEVADSGDYRAPIDIELRPGDRLELRAAQGRRPTIGVLNYDANRPNTLRIRSRPAKQGANGAGGRPRVVLDGLLVAGRALRLEGPMESVVIRHCTLLPGWSLEHDCSPRRPEKPSLELRHTGARVLIQRSIAGSIEVVENEVEVDPITIEVDDSILDATASELEAVGGPQGRHAHAVLTARRVTILGVVRVHAVTLAENAIFDGHVAVARRQTGCMRFCYVPAGSRTPRRYSCQPDLVEAARTAKFPPGPATAAERAARLRALEAERTRVRPLFASRRYGTATYCQLAPPCAVEIVRGADDESEMGAFHDLFQPQRAANLRTRLAEFTPAGMDAGIVYVT